VETRRIRNKCFAILNFTCPAGVLFFETRGRNTMPTKRKSKNPHIGSRLDEFLKEDGVFDEVQAQAIKEVLAWQERKSCTNQTRSKKRVPKSV
jgi:hypothetical protein